MQKVRSKGYNHGSLSAFRARQRAVEPTVNSALRHPLWSGLAIAAAASLFSVIATSYFQKQQLEASFAMSAVPIRISTCLALADYYKDYASPNDETTEVVLADGTETNVSTNAERRERAVNAARQLDLCLVQNYTVKGVNDCITLSMTDGHGNPDPYVGVIDTRSSSAPDGGGRWPGKWNPVC